MPGPCLSRGPQPHSKRGARGTRGALARMENAPLSSRAGAFHIRPRTYYIPSGVAQKGTVARPVPGSPPRHLGVSSSYCLAVWYPRPTLDQCGSSPPASLALRSLSPTPSTSSSRPFGFRFSTTLATCSFSARFALSTPSPALPRPADEGGASTPGVRFRPVRVSVSLPALAGRDPLPDPLNSLFLPHSSDPVPLVVSSRWYYNVGCCRRDLGPYPGGSGMPC